MEIGRLGEQFVFNNLLERTKNSQDFDFDTGHPLLGCGRVFEVEWVNGTNESRKPYDLVVYVEGNFYISPYSPSSSNF